MLGHEVRGSDRHQLAQDPRPGDGGARAHGSRRPRPPCAAVVDLHRDAAARRHQPRDGHRLEGAHPRRADLEPRRERGRGSLRCHPAPPRPGRRHPLRLALPRPGLRDQRPHHGAAQRPLRRRVPQARSRPHAAHLEDDRQGLRRAPRARLQPADRAARSHRGRRSSPRRASAARERSSPPMSRSTPARSSASRASSVPVAPSSRASSPAPTRPTPARSQVRGKKVALNSPVAGLAHGIAYSTENRRDDGIVGDLSVRENIMLAVQARRGWLRRVPAREVDQLVDDVHGALQRAPQRPRPSHPPALRRQPAEGAARPVARHEPRSAAARRADPRHRRRCEGRHPGDRRRARRGRDERRLHLLRAGRGRAALGADRHSQGPPEGRRGRQRTGRHRREHRLGHRHRVRGGGGGSGRGPRRRGGRRRRRKRRDARDESRQDRTAGPRGSGRSSASRCCC